MEILSGGSLKLFKCGQPNKFTFFFFFVLLIKELVWIALVPLWHFPDEQSHFGQLAFIAEKGRKLTYRQEDYLDLTEEIRKSEELLGTERDQLGINKFTYHPDYRIEYTTSLIGKYENEIKQLSLNLSNRKMVKHESSKYPSFYYAFLALFYRILYFQDLIIRVFIIRIVQTVFSLITVYFVWLIGKTLFNNYLLSFSLAALVGFQPMFSFVSAGINSDNIGNFAFTFYLLIAVRYLKFPCSLKRLVILLLSTIITFYFKPQFIIVLPMTIALIFFFIACLKAPKLKKIFLITLLIFIFIVIANLLSQSEIGYFLVYSRFLRNFEPTKFLSYLSDYVFPHLYKEVLPWYWGIYNWLGVTYPRMVHRLINWVILFSLFGFLIYLFRAIKSPKWPLKGVLFMIGAAIFLTGGIYMFDWLEYSKSNIHLGVQGRYFFPTISSHLLVMLLGISNLLRKKYQKTLIKILVFSMIFLNSYALALIASTYYDLSSFGIFILQVSQYKPWFFKGSFLFFLIIAYILMIGYTVIKIWKLKASDDYHLYDKENF